MCAINEKITTETVLLITLDLSQLKHRGAEHRDDQINYVCHSSVQGMPINHIQRLCFSISWKIFFLNFSIFAEWRPCQTRESRKSTIDWGIFQSQERELWIEAIHWSLDAVDQIRALPAPIPGRLHLSVKKCINFQLLRFQKAFDVFRFPYMLLPPERESFGVFYDTIMPYVDGGKLKYAVEFFKHRNFCALKKIMRKVCCKSGTNFSPRRNIIKRTKIVDNENFKVLIIIIKFTIFVPRDLIFSSETDFLSDDKRKMENAFKGVWELNEIIKFNSLSMLVYFIAWKHSLKKQNNWFSISIDIGHFSWTVYSSQFLISSFSSEKFSLSNEARLKK